MECACAWPNSFATSPPAPLKPPGRPSIALIVSALKYSSRSEGRKDLRSPSSNATSIAPPTSFPTRPPYHAAGMPKEKATRAPSTKRSRHAGGSLRVHMRGSNRGRTGRALAVVGVRGWGLKIWKYLAELVRTDVRIRAGEQGVRSRSQGQVRVRVLRATPCVGREGDRQSAAIRRHMGGF